MDLDGKVSHCARQSCYERRETVPRVLVRRFAFKSVHPGAKDTCVQGGAIIQARCQGVADNTRSYTEISKALTDDTV